MIAYSFAQKGFIYTKVALPQNEAIHLVATHTQASWNPITIRSREVRANQFKQIQSFLRHTIDVEHDPEQRAVMIVGDLNVDAIGSK